MENNNHEYTLKNEIMEIEALIEKWQPAQDHETRWALNMLKLGLYRRQLLLSELADAEAVNWPY